MNNKEYIGSIENCIKTTMQEQIVAKIVEDKYYKKKINDIKLNMYLRYFRSFGRSFKG